MPAQILFDRLAYVDRLKAGSFSEQQARAAADALGDALVETVATKADIAQLDTRIAEVRTEIAQSKNDTIRWMFGFNLVLVGAIFGILKLFH